MIDDIPDRVLDKLRDLDDDAPRADDDALVRRWADVASATIRPPQKPWFRTPGGMTAIATAALVAGLGVVVVRALSPSAQEAPSPTATMPAALAATASPPSTAMRAEPGGQDVPVVDIASLPNVAGTAVAAGGTRVAPAIARDETAISAAELFRRANELRQANQRAEAEAAYEEVERRFPRSEEAGVSRITLGRLYAQEGKTSAALAQFDAYLAGHGALREEALIGRATALAKLGRADDERQAWSELLRQCPDSVAAPRARARIAASSGD
jgi:TolA-binding protein